MVHETIRDDDMIQGTVLVVQVPAREADLAEFRDYIVESLSMGVLVLGPGMTYSVERFPAMGGVQVEGQTVLLRAHDVQPGAGPKPPKPTPAAEKTAILERLRSYREQHGLGCLKQVARGKVTEDLLRSVLSGSATLTIQEWRAIGRALDRVEKQEGASE